MVANSGEKYKEIKTILVSQPQPTHTNSSYFELERKYGIKVDFRPFIHVEEVPLRDFRKQRVRPDEYTAIIFTSRNSVDNFFRVCEEMRIKMPAETKYFCLSEAIALYLQKFITYRKRKVFFGKKIINDLKDVLLRYKDKEKFLLPCSDVGKMEVAGFLKENNISYQEAILYRTVSSDLSDLADITYDVLVFFSPFGITSLFENFPDFKQNETRIATFGSQTTQAAEAKDLVVNIKAPLPEAPSMIMALEHYLQRSNTAVIKE